MCLLVLAFRQLPGEPVLLAANRDEFHDRPAAPAQFWPEAPRLLAGRDLLAGGTWLGLTRHGRFAAVTNYREPPRGTAPRASRGHLVRDYLLGAATAGDYLRALQRRADDYAGFNLLLGDAGQLWWYSNRGGPPQRLAPGVYGLSNALLDTVAETADRQGGFRRAVPHRQCRHRRPARPAAGPPYLPAARRTAGRCRCRAGPRRQRHLHRHAALRHALLDRAAPAQRRPGRIRGTLARRRPGGVSFSLTAQGNDT